MAQRRMFSKEVTTSDLFVDMPSSSQLLYFHLGMEADDEGFIGNAKMLSRAYGSNNDDLKLLEAKGFIIAFPSGVTVVKDWNLNNKIRKDRQKPTIYTEEKTLLSLDSKGSYLLGNQVSTIPQPNAFQEKSSGEDINSLLSEYLDSFIEFSSKNIAKRAMAQVEFMKLSSEEKKQAVIGAKNYFEWYKQENPEDKTKKFSINSYAFLESATFKSFQQKVKVKKETLGGLI